MDLSDDELEKLRNATMSEIAEIREQIDVDELPAAAIVQIKRRRRR